jgi:hypothetical protein
MADTSIAPQVRNACHVIPLRGKAYTNESNNFNGAVCDSYKEGTLDVLISLDEQLFRRYERGRFQTLESVRRLRDIKKRNVRE